MKHRVQWKLMGIMFISVFVGVFTMGICEGLVFNLILHKTAEEAEKYFAEYSYIFNIVFILMTITIFIILSRKIIKRIEILNNNTVKIAEGKIDKFELDNHNDELGNLSKKMYEMALSIEQSIEKEHNMICNLAHDLRTPITSISGYVELIDKEALTDQGKEYIEIVSRKTKDLTEQIKELLEYSILDFKEKEYEMEKLSLSRLLEQVLIDFIPILEEQNFKYKLSGNIFECMCSCNRILCVRLFENLITNAIRYGKKKRQIDIDITESESVIQINFTNYGNTIPIDKIGHLFEGLYRGIDASEYETESKGLGLTIAKRIMDIHGGTINVNNNEIEEKVTFQVLFQKS